jgi:hypothetical protein
VLVRGLLAIALGIGLALTARGHAPGNLSGEFVVPNPESSWALFGNFVTGHEVDTIDLDLQQDFATIFEVMVQHRAAWAEFRPRFAVVGPGLPPPDDGVRALLPRPVPAGAGVYLERNDDLHRIVYFEGVTRDVLWTSGAIALPLRRGENQIWIWSPDHQTGDYIFGLGVEEDFSTTTLSDFPGLGGAHAQ